jgi:sRNA-binding carbon storage regulator CsrA
VLARKLAEKLVISEAECKNRLLASYGYPEMYGDEAIVYKTNAPEDFMIQREEVHSKLVKAAEENGLQIFFYRLYRGSHTYNAEEMAHLIEGTIQECKAQGIETATPDELARMAALWENRRK